MAGRLQPSRPAQIRTRDKIVLFSIAFSGLLFIGLGIPLILEKISPNSSYGFRTEKTLSDPMIWYAANRVSGWGMVVAGTVIFLGSVGILTWGSSRMRPGQASYWALGLFTVALLGALAHGVWYINGL